MQSPDSGWVRARQLGAARVLEGAISATHLSHVRPGFGWTVHPAKGSVLASRFPGHWDPEPDYFHHWIRDAAIVTRAVPHAIALAPDTRPEWVARLKDYIGFSLAISDPDRHGPASNPLRPTTREDHLQYLRPDAELAFLHGARWLEEPRCVADGSPDPERWTRPQDDGPALRLAGLLHLVEALPELDTPETARLMARDGEHLLRIAGRPAIGPWEEPPARRVTFSLIAAWDALDRLARRGAYGGGARQALASTCENLLALILAARDPDGSLRESIEAAPGHHDGGTLLALLDADRWEGPLALDAEAAHMTLLRLDALFGTLYPINHGRDAPGLGRWREDAFFGGNPWYPVTLGAAEFEYRLALRRRERGAFARAEARMALIQTVAPDGDALPEQFDRVTGAARSSPDLTWSAAAFLGAAAARQAALDALG